MERCSDAHAGQLTSDARGSAPVVVSARLPMAQFPRLPVRLEPAAIATIKREVADMLGDDARVRLFGSRLGDTLKCGDVDLLVEVDRPVDRAIWNAFTLGARPIRAPSGRKVEVTHTAPSVPEQSIHHIARAKAGAVVNAPGAGDGAFDRMARPCGGRAWPRWP